MKTLLAAVVAAILALLSLPLLFGGSDGAEQYGVDQDAIPEHQDIPPVAMAAYVRAAATKAASDVPCRVSWALLAGIGKVETNHGRFGGSVPQASGDVEPSILGVILDGSLPGTRPILDTDDGVLDHHRVFDRAVGPMQFIPGTWATYGIDADGDGSADPQNLFDAAAAAAEYLCDAARDDIATDTGRRQAVGAYNQSYVYVSEVLAHMTTYLAEADLVSSALPNGAWTDPAPQHVRVSSGYGYRIHPITGTRRLHAGVDLACAAGSPIVAAGSGRVLYTRREGGAGNVVWLEHAGGVRTRYLHLQSNSFAVSPGQEVAAGQHLADCGSTGASTGPHLHFEVYPEGGGTIDPEPFMAARGVVL